MVEEYIDNAMGMIENTKDELVSADDEMGPKDPRENEVTSAICELDDIQERLGKLLSK